MMKIKKGDFVEIDYVGRIKEGNTIFDLTSEELAKKEGIHQPNGKYGAKIICVGEGTIVKGIDTFLEGKEIKKYSVTIGPEDAFGKKNAKLIKIIPLNVFKKQNIKPFPGLQFNVDGLMGIVKAVSGGRVVADFNHPLAGRDIVYEITVKRLVSKVEEKIKAYIEILFGREIPFTYSQKKLVIEFSLPEKAQKHVGDQIKKIISEIKDVKFEEKKKATTGK